MDQSDNTNDIENANNNNINNINNQYYEKPLHGNQIASLINIKDSTNIMKSEKIDIPNTTFNFLKTTGQSYHFNINDLGEISYLYQTLKSKIKYVICILVKDDTYFSSKLLEKTLEGIKENIDSLNPMSIDSENILICVFFNEIRNNAIFSENEINSLNNNNGYILIEKSYMAKDINTHCISTMNYMSEVEILKVFYTCIISQLRVDNGIIFSSVITAGVNPTRRALINLLKIASNSTNQIMGAIVVPPLEENNKEKNLFLKIQSYERIHFNLYNMNLYNMTTSVPISSLLNTMAINNKLSKDLNSFYNIINKNASIDYHDYNLSLYLFRNNHEIIYYNISSMGIIYYSELKENPICDYKDAWVQRYCGYYGNFFTILQVFYKCLATKNFKFLFLFFYIVGLMIEFIFPSLFTMVIYTIFYEAFNIYDPSPAVFFTLLYLFVFICSGACSLISNESQQMRISILFFYFFTEIFYLFILICSIIAMDNVKKNKNGDSYKFNTAAITCIIIFTFIPGILPMILRIKSIFENIIPMILYLLLGAPSSSSNFYIAKILNASDASGGENVKERKGIYIITFLLFNLFFGSLTFYNWNRQKRVDAVMIFGILYLTYNFFKANAIVISLKDSDKIIINNINVSSNIYNSNNINYIKNSNNNENYNENNNENYNENYNGNNNKDDNRENNNDPYNYPSQSQIENNYNNNYANEANENNEYNNSNVNY